ncbi:hypothetical protein H6F98_12010 [Microcoleus sp. FACHB-SPT15]|uniref:hypothetical protein n=1 Tax=Microcoleus sp. FACHB-SPT15 TaxID=2692830 RepID=UPI0017830195|nr:hypothetical protein [Microcoleus sp. FACHB-SPT15]MBD1806172.1 hypothetical protein [Microcoleus sp. FACHB-SPT15]
MLKLTLLVTFSVLANMSLKRTSKKTGAPKALYESTHIRIPVPVKEQVEEVSDWYRGLLRRGVKVEKLPYLMEVFEWAEIFQEASEKIDELIEEQKKREDEVLQPGKTSNNHDSYEYYLNSKAYKETKETLLGIKKILEKVNEKSFNPVPENVLPQVLQNQQTINSFLK